MAYTIEDARKWIADNRTELDSSRTNSESQDVQMLNRILPEKSRELWDSGCWIAEVMREHGASKSEISDAQFASGQRAFGGDCLAFSVQYANEYAETKQIQDKPGVELADKICDEVLGKK